MASEHPPPLRVLSLCTVFPNPTEPGCGIFIARRLQALAALRNGPRVTVLAPVQLLDYAKRRQRLLRARGVVSTREDAAMRVMHPKWFYPPLSGASSAVFLFARLLPLCWRLRRRGFRFDLIDAHFAHPEGVAAAMLGRVFRCPVIITLRGNEVVHAKRPLRRWTQRWALRRATRIICVARWLEDFAVSAGVAVDRVITIPNGVDAGVFYRRDRAACRRIHDLPIGSRVILSAGYLVEGKGHHDVVAALATLHSRGIAARLVIAGGSGRDGNFEPAIRHSVRSRGLSDYVRLTGAVSPTALAELMAAADVLCLASFTEGWPNVVHEALACGTPVVATAVGAVPQLIPGPRYGRIVPVHDPQALADALGAALETAWAHDEIARWGQSRQWRQVAKEVLTTFNDACQGEARIREPAG